MHRRKSVYWYLASITVMIILLASQSPVWADGAPIPTDPELWANLKETMQIALITLGSDGTAHVDLFISMLDPSGESHKIIFLLPLGIAPADFHVSEKTSWSFEHTLTQDLDEILRKDVEKEVSYRNDVRRSLLPGMLLIHGGWGWPLWLLLTLSGCGPSSLPAPLATYETDSSQVAIYGIDANTDLQALISTTGLDPAVQETLSRLEGQQIAVVTLQTQPMSQEGGHGWVSDGEPGIHLAWATTLVTDSAGATYAYPLGTGSAWARPIELTRVYVVAPPGVDFVTHYPRLGLDLSGFTRGESFRSYQPRILGAKAPAYAVENAVGNFGRIWRVTYVRSNASEDVVITRLPEMSQETLVALGRPQFQQRILRFTWPISLTVALMVWVTAWRYLMPRMLGVEYRWFDFKLWRDAVRWALLYLLTNAVALIGLVPLVVWNSAAGLIDPGPVTPLVILLLLALSFLGVMITAALLLITLFGPVNLILFSQERSRTLGVSKGRAAAAYIAVVLVANVAYLLFAAGYMALVGAS